MEESEDIQMDPRDILDTSKWLPNAKMLSCEICDQKFSNKLKIVMHWATNHNYKLCGFCTCYAFKYESDLMQHERLHIPFGCSSCKYNFYYLKKNLKIFIDIFF